MLKAGMNTTMQFWKPKSPNCSSIEMSSNKCKTAWNIIKSSVKDTKNKSNNIYPDKLKNFIINSVNNITSSFVRPSLNSTDLLAHQTLRQVTMQTFTSFAEVSPEMVLNIVKTFKPTDSIGIYDVSHNLLKKTIHSTVCH